MNLLKKTIRVGWSNVNEVFIHITSSDVGHVIESIRLRCVFWVCYNTGFLGLQVEIANLDRGAVTICSMGFFSSKILLPTASELSAGAQKKILFDKLREIKSCGES